MRPTDTDIAWLAGIVDGEGTISVHRSNAKRYKHPYLVPVLQIANTDLRILEKARSVLTAITGNPHNLIVSNKGGNGCKRGYRIKVGTQHELVLVLPLLMPFLQGKAEQASITLDFCKRKHARLKYRWYEHKEQDELDHQRCLELNRRGEPQAQSADVIELRRSA